MTLRDVMEFYAHNIGKAYPPYAGGGRRWVLSTATVESLFREALGREPEEGEIGPEGNTLCGLPIRIDDSVEGLSFEYV